MGKRILNKAVFFVLGACLLGAAPAFAQGGGSGLVKALAQRTRKAWLDRQVSTSASRLRAGSLAIRTGAERLPSVSADLWDLERIMKRAKEGALSQEIKQQSIELAREAQTRLSYEESQFFLARYPFLPTHTEFSLHNNRNIIKLIPKFAEQLDFVKKNRRTILRALEISKTDREGMYARAVAPEARLILLGEVHYSGTIHREVERLLQEYRAQHPERKIVVFSEFLPEAGPGWGVGLPVPPSALCAWEDYTCDVINHTQRLNVEYYGLEDRHFLHTEVPERAGTPDARNSFLAVWTRNRVWSETIRSVMARVRLTDPDAAFFVYAGKGHTDKTVMGSLSALLREENPFVVHFDEGFESGFLGVLLEEGPFVSAPVARRHVLRWKGGKGVYSRHIGFDVQVLVPRSNSHLFDIPGE